MRKEEEGRKDLFRPQASSDEHYGTFISHLRAQDID
jgi:hypothetical protein